MNFKFIQILKKKNFYNILTKKKFFFFFPYSTTIQLNNSTIQHTEKSVLLNNTCEIDYSLYENASIEIQGRDIPSPKNNFHELELDQRLLKNIEKANYKQLIPVQKYSIPIILEGRDIISCSQTGSGKTAAFLFPIISNLLKEDGIKYNSRALEYPVYPRSVVLSPTRELAYQLVTEAWKFTMGSHLRTKLCCGGLSISRQMEEIRRGCDILIGTPGRINDFLKNKIISLSKVNTFVLDEADTMLDMGFEPQIRNIVQNYDLPETDKRQTLMFSATFPVIIRNMAKDFLKSDHVFLSVGKLGEMSDLVKQHFVLVKPNDDRNNIILDILKEHHHRILIFTKTKLQTTLLESFLSSKLFNVAALHGDLDQRKRSRSLSDFSLGRANILVATDVASRGLDIKNIHHVINYEMPNYIDDYVHRIGRTGRAGNLGKATTLIDHDSFQTNRALKSLILMLKEKGHEIPSWMEELFIQNELSKSPNYQHHKNNQHYNNHHNRNQEHLRLKHWPHAISNPHRFKKEYSFDPKKKNFNE